MNTINNDDICLILQGPPFSKEQLLKDVKIYSLILKNIIISSYSNLIDDELYNYAKIINNDKIGENLLLNNKVRSTNNIVDIRYDKSDLIEGFNIGNVDNDDDNNWVDINNWRRLLTIKRGIICANEYFKESKYYFILRADMTINNFEYIINKWKNLDRKIIDNIFFKEKIIFKYNNEHEKIHNITDYLLFGNKTDIINFSSYNKKPIVKHGKGAPERVTMRGYINIIDPTITDEYVYTSFMIHEKELDINWYKYKLFGIWGLINTNQILNNPKNNNRKILLHLRK